MREIGRLRELTFRVAGGGTGKDCDIDGYDIDEVPYLQLIVWNPEEKEITGGYRFQIGRNLMKNADGKFKVATAGLFHLSEKFEREFLPYTIELGRSFVQPLYQLAHGSRRGIYSLDNLWDGLGALIADNPDMKYFYGKMTMYPHFNQLARDYLLVFFDKYFPDPDSLFRPIIGIGLHNDEKMVQEPFVGISDYKEAHKVLSLLVRNTGEVIPPLVNAYMNLSPSMRTFGTAINEHFGKVEETGLMVTISHIYEYKKKRHIETYYRDKVKRRIAPDSTDNQH
ncbi:GNAT family N-acetyltransferase, partial [Patescibacteria group bacterium]|nr:GNAT family N-acetyltransferase [Patescibacteria group bacterium]